MSLPSSPQDLSVTLQELSCEVRRLGRDLAYLTALVEERLRPFPGPLLLLRSRILHLLLCPFPGLLSCLLPWLASSKGPLVHPFPGLLLLQHSLSLKLLLCPFPGLLSLPLPRLASSRGPSVRPFHGLPQQVRPFLGLLLLQAAFPWSEALRALLLHPFLGLPPPPRSSRPTRKRNPSFILPELPAPLLWGWTRPDPTPALG